jgi:phage replication O-like protein O
MANPQLEDGFLRIANEIVAALWKVNLSAYESRVLWFIFSKTYGFKKTMDWIALSQFAKSLGLDRRLIHRALKSLSSKKMIVIGRDDKNRPTYGFQKDYAKWAQSFKKTPVIGRDDALSSKEIPTKDTLTKDGPGDVRAEIVHVESGARQEITTQYLTPLPSGAAAVRGQVRMTGTRLKSAT